jgi:hypothetical protein
MIVSIQASAAHPSLVCAHWRNALAATVTQLTFSAQIRHFVMVITTQVHARIEPRGAVDR